MAQEDTEYPWNQDVSPELESHSIGKDEALASDYYQNLIDGMKETQELHYDDVGNRIVREIAITTGVCVQRMSAKLGISQQVAAQMLMDLSPWMHGLALLDMASEAWRACDKEQLGLGIDKNIDKAIKLLHEGIAQNSAAQALMISNEFKSHHNIDIKDYFASIMNHLISEGILPENEESEELS